MMGQVLEQFSSGFLTNKSDINTNIFPKFAVSGLILLASFLQVSFQIHNLFF